MEKEKTTAKDYLTLKKVNIVIRILTVSDFIILSGYGLVTPIFAVFIANSIEGGSVEVAGIASAIYLISKSIFQVPIAFVIDKIKGEKDDFWALLFGSVLFSIIPLFYLIISKPIEVYIVQFFYGLATAITVPAWYAIFTRHIDREHEGLEWGIYRTLIDLGSAGGALIGGFLAFRFGFSPLFVLLSITSFIGSFFLLLAYKKMKPAKIL